MKFMNIEFGKTDFGPHGPSWIDYLNLNILRSSCGCIISDISIFYLTFMSKECHKNKNTKESKWIFAIGFFDGKWSCNAGKEKIDE